MTSWTREDLAWAAGLFEGEGCIALGRRTKAGRTYEEWHLVIASTDEDVLERFRERVEVGKVTGPRQRGHYKPVWTWRLHKKAEVYALLVALYPWLGERRRARAAECLTAMGAAPTLSARRCKQGHPWRPDTVVKKMYGGSLRRVCATCLDEGRIEIRSEAVAS